jgi:hypothetical protein
MDQEDLEKRFELYLADPTSGSNIVDLELRKIVAMLGLSVLKLDVDVKKLDRTSTFLARVNIGVGGVVVAIGVIQVVLMLRGH